MTELLEFFLFSATSLFTMINPIGVVPIYIAMTEEIPAPSARRVAAKATLTAFLALVLFALAGDAIFRFFSITVDSLRIVGGVLFFILGFDMLKARVKAPVAEPGEALDPRGFDAAVTPLAIPYICGPGAITMVILVMKEAETPELRLAFFAGLGVVCLATGLILLSGRRLVQLLGRTGNSVLMRLMGLIVMVIAVEFFFAGLAQMVKRMLTDGT